ncbi:MAG: sugar nucleotide-binding protein [Myxococcales bacterium]|nr:sugar nucleotide-binding protein [Myxococcales bacterium]
MRALVTGARGTIGRALTAHLVASGGEALAWDRGAVAMDDYWAMERTVRDSGAEVLFHLAIASTPTGREDEAWKVNYEWTSELAWICRQLDLRFVFTSTAMVFSNAAVGPFTVASAPDASEGYGHQKRLAEARVMHQHPRAVIARLGWQLAMPGTEPGDNTMQRNFDRQMAEHGCVRASTRWLPACSFVDDTAQALVALADAAPGLYHLDSNERWTFHDIASALSAEQGERWRIVATDDFVYDQRLADDRISLPSLRSRLPLLR